MKAKIGQWEIEGTPIEIADLMYEDKIQYEAIKKTNKEKKEKKRKLQKKLRNQNNDKQTRKNHKKRRENQLEQSPKKSE